MKDIFSLEKSTTFYSAGQSLSAVADVISQQLLSEILIELKKINMQLSLITDNDVTEEDVLS